MTLGAAPAPAHCAPATLTHPPRAPHPSEGGFGHDYSLRVFAPLVVTTLVGAATAAALRTFPNIANFIRTVDGGFLSRAATTGSPNLLSIPLVIALAVFVSLLRLNVGAGRAHAERHPRLAPLRAAESLTAGICGMLHAVARALGGA